MFDSFDLIIFLIVVNIGFAVLITVLFAYVIVGKIIAVRREAQKRKLFADLEEAFLALLVENDATAVEKMLKTVRLRELENFIEFVSVYLTNLKGEDFEKVAGAVYKSPFFKHLCECTVSTDLDLKLYSICCLGLLKRPACVDDLFAALEDPNLFVRMAAVSSIAQIGCVEALDRVLETLSREKMVTSFKLSETLWLFGENACRPLFDRLKKRDGKIIKINENDMLTASVIEILGHHKYFEAAGEIHSILRESRGNLIIKSCITALGKLVYADAAEDIKAFLDSPDPELRLAAIKAVLELRALDQMEKLKLLLNDADWNVRYGAATALYEMDFDFQGYMFSPELAGIELSRAFRTIVHVLAEKSVEAEETAA